MNISVNVYLDVGLDKPENMIFMVVDPACILFFFPFLFLFVCGISFCLGFFFCLVLVCFVF